MTAALRLGRQYLSTYYALMLEYRAEILLWVLVGCFPFIMMGVWIKAAGGGAYELTPTQFIQYFIGVFIVRQFTIVWVIWEMERAIVEGLLSSQLLKPVDPVWGYVAMHLAEQASRLPFWIGLVVIAFCCFPQALWVPHAGTLALAVLAIVLAFTLRFILQYTFAMLSFWIERASAIEQLSFLPYMFLSGMVAPLAVFPKGVREFALWTPFPYLVNFPVQLLIGDSKQIAAGELERGFAIVMGWIVGLTVLNRWLWRKGLRRYSGMGA